MAVAILLSTFNGELFLSEQIESILYQTYNDWMLYVRDDGSTDTTPHIIDDYCRKFSNKIVKINDSLGNLGSMGSFMYMLSSVESDHYMFCDQDDVWLPFKIEKTISKMRNIESENFDKTILVFTDLILVDFNLKPICNSMWQYLKMNPDNALNFYTTTCLSTVTGCTMMLNRKLREMVLPFPASARMHDWWISLNAVHYGVVDYISEPTIYYRQHNNNAIGAKRKHRSYYVERMLNLKDTVVDNFKVFQMLKALKFKVNFFRVLSTKFMTILLRRSY